MVALEAGRVSAKDLSPDLLRQLRSFKNADIDQGIEKVYGAVKDISADKQAEIEKYRRVFRAGGSTPGEASRGRAVYAKTCAQCHALFDVGGKVGPDLTGSNRGDLDYILQNMVDPNAVIPNEYRSTSIEMKDDRSIIGIVKQSDDKAVTVVTANDTLTLPRGEIKSQRLSEISMMPEGLLAQLTDQEVRDLIYYLSRPGQVPLPGEK
jgi:putative heme-binding domain-containing protein